MTFTERTAFLSLLVDEVLCLYGIWLVTHGDLTGLWVIGFGAICISCSFKFIKDYGLWRQQ